MLQITAQMRVLVALESVDGRKGIDGLARLCRQVLDEDPFSGAVFLFRNRSHNTISALCYDGQGYWLCQKRLSTGRFKWWPSGKTSGASLEVHQVQMLLSAGDPNTRCAPIWRRVTPAT
jgi:transposase